MQTFPIPTFVINSSMNIGNNVKVPSKTKAWKVRRTKKWDYHITSHPHLAVLTMKGEESWRCDHKSIWIYYAPNTICFKLNKFSGRQRDWGVSVISSVWNFNLRKAENCAVAIKFCILKEHETSFRHRSRLKFSIKFL